MRTLQRATRVIGVAESAVSSDTAEFLTTYALGSCMAVTMYDHVAGVGGMLHALLPEQSDDESRRRSNPSAYTSTGVPALLDACLKRGALKHRLRVHAAGGASVLQDSKFFDVGRRNHLSLRKALWKAGLLLQAEAVGGNSWRTVQLEMATGKVWVKEGGGSYVELSAGQRGGGKHA